MSNPDEPGLLDSLRDIESRERAAETQIIKLQERYRSASESVKEIELKLQSAFGTSEMGALRKIYQQKLDEINGAVRQREDSLKQVTEVLAMVESDLLKLKEQQA